MVINTSTSNALQTVTAAQHKVQTAAQQIATFPVQDNEVGSSNYKSTDYIKPVLSLSEAELQNSAGVKLLLAEKGTIGTFINTAV